ncbi:EF-hand domain-containing protein [Streptomyces sp. JJ36]|nr:EF-hand domain-containing protein [Streptomyces sp. JJ36]
MFDRDGDGFVTAAEFHKAMAELGDVHYTESMAQAVLNTKDRNADGKLSFEEFLEAHRAAR